MKGEENPAPEIVIIRRGGGEDQAGAKGGAWKIAYADFVTAMMAFFLVMWLINASNEETRAQVASYFNPIKLTDSTTGARSLKDMKESRSAKKPGSNKDTEGQNSIRGGVQECRTRKQG
jgi:chemotaxis protein MotB